jgi:hypothetical protein
MNSVDLPLGQREGQTLEFKAAAAMANLFDIGREVVAFLNSDRTVDLWIGLTEGPDGRAVGVEPIDVSRIAALENHLHDTIFPHVDAAQVESELVAVDGGHVLRLRIMPPTWLHVRSVEAERLAFLCTGRGARKAA